MNRDVAYGPAMLALNQRQREFVLAYLEHPTAKGHELVAMAGYTGQRKNRRETASRFLHAPAIIAAINEVLGKTYRGRGAAVAQDVMLTIAGNPNHPKQLQAALALADRGGFGAVVESRLTVQDQTSEALIARITVLAKRLGINPTRLLGGPVIDADGSDGGGPARRDPHNGTDGSGPARDRAADREPGGEGAGGKEPAGDRQGHSADGAPAAHVRFD